MDSLMIAVWHGEVRRGLATHGWARSGEAWLGMDSLMIWRGKVWQGEAVSGEAWRRVARRGMD
jgi:hypothetical protein